MPNLPYSDKLPTPQEFVATTYDFTEQLLISQRKFAESLLEAMKPLLGAGNGTTARRAPPSNTPQARRARESRPAAHLHANPTALPLPGPAARSSGHASGSPGSFPVGGENLIHVTRPGDVR